MNKILIVEDDLTIRRGISISLKLEEYVVTEAENGQEAIDKLQDGNIDLIILDVMLPKKNGFEVLKYVRENTQKWIPIIMLTAKSEEEDKIAGLELGADDYMTKPFSNRELVARVQANLRKYKIVKYEEKVNIPFDVDVENYHLVFSDGVETVTKKELQLINFLLSNINKILTKSEILENVWGQVKANDTRTVDIHISKLRKKLFKHDCDGLIVTKHGVGYGIWEMIE